MSFILNRLINISLGNDKYIPYSKLLLAQGYCNARHVKVNS